MRPFHEQTCDFSLQRRSAKRKIHRMVNSSFGAILRRSPNRFPRKSLSSARRLRARNARSPHQKNRPLIHFLRFPPSYFSFLVEKVGFSGGSTTINGRGGRASLGRQSRRATRSRQLSLSSLITYRPKL